MLRLISETDDKRHVQSVVEKNLKYKGSALGYTKNSE